jgi:hypothetical protein
MIPSEIARVKALRMSALIDPTMAPHTLHLSVTCSPARFKHDATDAIDVSASMREDREMKGFGGHRSIVAPSLDGSRLLDGLTHWLSSDNCLSALL